MAHTVRQQDFSSISFLLSIGLMAANFMDFGYRLKLVKEFSGQKTISIERIMETLIVKLSVSIIFFIVFYIYIFISRSEDGQTIEQILFFLLGAFFLSLANFFIQFFYAIKNYRKDFYANLLYTVLLLLGVTIGIGTDHVILGTGIAFFISSFFMSLFSAIEFKKQFIGTLSFPKVTISQLLKELKVSIPFSLHVILGALYVYVDIIFVEYYLGDSSLATYFIYNRYIYGMSLVTMTFGTFLFPYIAQYYNEGRSIGSALHFKLVKWQNIIKYISVIGALLSLLIMEPLITLLFGLSYNILESYKYIASFLFFIKVTMITPSLIITCDNNQMVRVYGILVALIISVSLYPLLLPKYGLGGAIFVNAISILVVSIIYGYFSYKKENTPFGLNRYE